MWAEPAGGSETNVRSAEAARYAMLAVGTKAGRVWLWRYRLPGSYAARGAGRAAADGFALVSRGPPPGACNSMLCLHKPRIRTPQQGVRGTCCHARALNPLAVGSPHLMVCRICACSPL